MTNDIAIRYCDEYLARHIADIDKEFLEKAKEALQQEPKTDWIVPIILIDKKGEEHDGLMDMRRMLIYLHNIPAETAISLGYTWKSAEGSGEE